MRNKLGQFIKGHSGYNKKPNSGSFKKGQIPWNKKLTKEIDKRIMKYALKLKGKPPTAGSFKKGHLSYKGIEKGWFKKGNTKEKAPNWRGGISIEPYSIDWTEILRRAIRERDNYICQLTGQYGNIVHHIDYDKKNCDPKNLITLSKSSNSKVNFNRKYWENYFSNHLLKRIWNH